MTPAERLLAAADLLENRLTCIRECAGCKEDAHLALVFRSAVVIERSNRMSQKRPDRLLKALFRLADTLLAGAS